MRSRMNGRIIRLLLALLLLTSALATPGATSPALATPNPAPTSVALAARPQSALQEATPSLQDPIQDEVFYFVLPDRFANGSAANDTGGDPGGATDTDVLRHGFKPNDKGYYHGGDLKGLIEKLDYLQNLGVTSIWMAPIFKNRPVQGDGTIASSSAGYHGYWITDFTQVDPHFGTNDELKALIAAARARGLKVFFDIITNHTADVIDYQNPGDYGYRSKADAPYRDAGGNRFDDADFAGTNSFPELNLYSFPYRPIFRSPADATIKKPDWLNDRTMYHNRGNSTFSGENSLYGDFFGLDDLFTEKPVVVDGMIDIYKYWIREFKIDGFRIDTVKHVNIEFWQKFAPEIKAYAQSQGLANFFLFGEVFSGDVPFLSQYTTEAKLPAVLDFGFQGAARGFASSSGATNNLRDFFAADDYYTDPDSNVYSLPTFLGNHDMGRFGSFLKQDNLGASDTELLARMKLGHALMFFVRGVPVIYYGDEQGFVGDGGDKDARQDMFPSQVASYNDDDLIGTTKTTADDNFDPTHPLYQAFKSYADILKANKALRRGAQIHRFSSGAAGVYAFSRIDRDEKVEYVLAFNNAETASSATFATAMANTTFAAVYPAGGTALTTNANAEITINVPALDFVIYKAASPLPASPGAPGISLSAPTVDEQVSGRFKIAANLDAPRVAEVTFAVKVGDAADYSVIGADNNAPYQVFYDAGRLPDGTRLSFKATVSDLAGNTNTATGSAVVGKTLCKLNYQYAIIHYQRSDGNYDGWGLHLWGDAIDPGEATTWLNPKPFIGETSYGRFAFVKLKDGSKPLNFIVHKGDEKDTPNDRSFIPNETPEVWLKQGDAANYGSLAAAQRTVRIYYQRPGGDYDGWGLYLWGDGISASEKTTWPATRPFTGSDSYGRYRDVEVTDPTKPIGVIVQNSGTKDVDKDRFFTPSRNAEIWLKQGDEAIYPSRGNAEDYAIIHYHRPGGDYGDYTSSNSNDFWGLHLWEGSAEPGIEWTKPLKKAGDDRFGVYFKVRLVDEAPRMAYIIHRGDNKDLPSDQFLDLVNVGHEVWVVQSTPGYVLPVPPGCVLGSGGNLAKTRAHWVTRDTIAWDAPGSGSASYQLHYSPSGGIALDGNNVTGGMSVTLALDPMGLPETVKAKFPHLAKFNAFKIGAADLDKVPAMLRGQIAVSAKTNTGALIEATGLQIPGVLDDMYTYDGKLGVVYEGTVPGLRLWAPTAAAVKLHRFANSTTPVSATVPMAFDPESGVWSVTGAADWSGQYYLYEVEVYVPATGKVERNLVTDPYAVSLTMNSTRSQIVDLASANLKPVAWDNLVKPRLDAPEDIVLYELHVRNFSINDQSVPAAMRGAFKAFTQRNSTGLSHLRSLAQAGLTHVHLLPAFDIATIEEDRSKREEADAAQLASLPPDSDQQQKLVTEKRDKDGFNWGYDPFHYNVPEGSYATNPDGTARIVEFREMVQALNTNGLRVVMDVVYNHTNAAGQNPKSVLDRIVPGYYYRLDENGAVTTSTCCANTATEHAMMEKLMIDSVVLWATAYKVDGFRFDLMGHHTVGNMQKLRAALDALTPVNSGVDGTKIYLYGEGWNFGEVADGVRGKNATQRNMPGSGIGTFSDRLRDAVRGGGPFDQGQDLKRQGFISGLAYDPNDLNQGTADEQKSRLLLYADQIRVGLAGNLSAYQFTDRTGATVRGEDVDYNGSPAGYTRDPQEVITYIEAHDNETLFDALQIKAPATTTLAERVRMQNLGISVVMLGQGVPFFQAGQDMLRSKSMDRNSYDSGDWFNKLDFTYTSNNWGVGLPPEFSGNKGSWDVMRPLLANPALKPGQAEIINAATHFREMLRIRKSSPLFRLRTAADIQERVSFLNTGPDQTPGLIVMSIADTSAVDLDPNNERIVVLFNATDEAQTFSAAALANAPLKLHPLQATSRDTAVRKATFNKATGTFTIPPRTTAVFSDFTALTMLPLVRR